MTWLNFLSSRNVFKFSVVAPAIIIGVTCPRPKKNKKIIEIVGFLACDTQAKRVANTGVIQGEEASPKVVPIEKGTRKDGILFSIAFKSGPFGNWNFRMPNKFNPIIIAITATIELKYEGICPYICPKKPLMAPKVTREKITPPEKLISLNLFLSVPPM